MSEHSEGILTTEKHKSPCPSPTLSVSALGYSDIEQLNSTSRVTHAPGQDQANTSLEETPKANAREGESQDDKQTPVDTPHREGAKETLDQTPWKADNATHDLREGSPQNTDTLRRTNPNERPGATRGTGSPMITSSPTPSTPKEEDGQEEEEGDDPEHWFETTENDVTINGKGFCRTATPATGWPRVYLAADPSFNIAPRMLDEWRDLEGPAIWARIYRGKYEPTEMGKTKVKDAIKTVIKNLVYIKYDESLAVIFPEQDLPPKEDNRFPHPYHALIVGLSQCKAQRLVNLEVVASPDTTIFFLPHDIPRQLYIMTIKGLRYNNTAEAKALVEDLVRNTFRTSPEIRAIVESKSSAPPGEALDQVLNIRASFILIKQRSDMARSWSIYLNENPEFSDEDYKLLRRKMRACSFKTVGFGKGYALTKDEQPICTGCKSADHDSYNCPFSQIPGWLGYKPDSRRNIAGENDFADDENGNARLNQPRTSIRGRERGRYNGFRGRYGDHVYRGRGRA